MGAVFVSYRRGDSEGQARALSLELTKLLGKDSVFMDVDSIALGRDFRQILQERLGSCDVVVALIGPGWIDAADTSGNRRLESPTDFVRQEIAAALKRNIPVIPVLVQGARMPASELLPEDLKDLSYRNGFELGHSTWESDVREMVRRLGLLEQQPRASMPRSTEREARRQGSAIPRAWLLTAAIVVIVGGAGLLVYFYPKQSATGTTALPAPSTSIAPPSTAVSQTAGAQPPATSGGGLAASGLEFNWPGDDCWDIFRGPQLVTYQCGAKQQALGAGTYTIKPKHAPIFEPFEVVVNAGSSTRVAMGGVVDFRWPGGDCWDMLRGDQVVTYECGAKQQALEAGTYTIKGKHAPVFTPFQIDIKSGSSTRIEKGGIFVFNWPGTDCWDIFRGPQLVTYQCGAKQQALGAGTYTIKGKHAPVFNAFEINVADGSQVKAP